MRAPFLRKNSRMDTASALPSSGSVPEPNSSSKTKSLGPQCLMIEITCVIWAENVLRLASILCSSPMSAKILWNIGNIEPWSAGINNPHWFIKLNSPNVLRDTVLPPVLEPVINKIRYDVPNWMFVGTTTFGGINGWRALMRLTVLSVLKIAGTPL